MLQAEIAGRTIPSCLRCYSAVGHVMRDFQLCPSEGHSVLLSDYRQRSNMVLVPSSAPHFSAELLSEFEIHQPDLAEKETRVLVIVAGSQPHASELKRPLRLNLEMLMGLSGRVHRSMGAGDQPSFLLYSSRSDLERYLPHSRSRMRKVA
jgi:hypothetical protein